MECGDGIGILAQSVKLPSDDSKQDVRHGNAHLIEWISLEAIDHFIHLRWFFEHVRLIRQSTREPRAAFSFSARMRAAKS